MRVFSSRPNAQATVRGGELAPQLSGEVKFYQKRNGVLVVAVIGGLPPNNLSNFFAFHIHEGDSCGGENFSDTGMHFDKTGSPHPYHSGDLPPLMRTNEGAYLAVLTDRFTISDIIGKTVVIHSGTDDFKSQPSGNAGDKIGCGLIKKAY